MDVSFRIEGLAVLTQELLVIVVYGNVLRTRLHLRIEFLVQQYVVLSELEVEMQQLESALFEKSRWINAYMKKKTNDRAGASRTSQTRIDRFSSGRVK